MNENNRIIKNQAGVIYTLDSRQLLTKMSFFEIPKKSADIGHEFCTLTKTKHMGHVSHSILVPEFKFGLFDKFDCIQKHLQQTPFCQEMHTIKCINYHPFFVCHNYSPFSEKQLH